MRRGIVVLIAAALVVGACGGHQEIYEQTPRQFEAAGELGLPPAIPAAPAFIVTSKHPLGTQALAKIRKIKGVAVAAPVALRTVKLAGEKLRVASINPLQYRSVAPASTRDADFVWLSLLSGGAVATHDTARRLGLGDDSELTLPGFDAVPVGAFADNGAPQNIADVVVSSDSDAAAVGGVVKTVVVGAKTGTVLQRLQRALRQAVPAAHLKKLSSGSLASAPPSGAGGAAPAPASGTAGGGLIGTMSFEILKDGFIRPDPAWVRSNIAYGTVPIVGNISCHRLMFPQLRAALTEIQQRDLDRFIRPGDYGGCFVPRFIDRNPAKPLSMHAFGLAVDFNVSTNGLGTRGDMHPAIVEIFEKWGFEWGGRWSRPDPMHFELDRLLSG